MHIIIYSVRSYVPVINKMMLYHTSKAYVHMYCIHIYTKQNTLDVKRCKDHQKHNNYPSITMQTVQGGKLLQGQGLLATFLLKNLNSWSMQFAR